MRSLPVRAQALTAVVVLSNLAGNALLSFGLKGRDEFTALVSPSVLCGVALLALWTVTRASLMSWADLSYVLPVTAIGYVLTAVVGSAFLHEQVTWIRWAATLLIVAGIILAGTTSPKTTRDPVG
ncbi:MAG: hypothetical protein H7Y20_16725 [Bryobacteraceae bacterium]|nr:hypothetical protein [Bryobacteraceae bacterium]